MGRCEELGSTWSSSRGDEERLGGADGNGLVGVVIRVVREHLREQTECGSRTEPESLLVGRGLTRLLLVSSRVSFQALGRRQEPGLRRGPEKGGGAQADLHGLVLAVGAQAER